MPYISPAAQRELMSQRNDRFAVNPGELNFILTKICDEYIARHGLSYKTIADVVSSLECAKLEFYRRVAAPYEDGKKQTNGDVYTCVPTI